MNAGSVFRSRRVVLADGVRPATVHVRDGVIERVSGWDDTLGSAELTDTGDAALLPGVVDTHVHINEPGRTEWEGFACATRAAALGGVTTLVDMPLNCDPPTTTVRALAAKLAATSGKLNVDVGFWGGVVPGNRAALQPLWEAGVFGFKAFMCPSGIDEFPAATTSDLRAALGVLGPLGAPLLVHAEAPEALCEAIPDADANCYATFLDTHPPEAETSAIETLIALARASDARVHVVHLATSSALPMLAAARASGVKVTVETCPHYLHFASQDVPDGKFTFKCAPPIRGERDRDGLWEGLRSGIIDLVATDHSPCLPALKQVQAGGFVRAWGGIASLQLSLSIMWSGARVRGLSLLEVARWMCEAPARLAGLRQKGAIAPGKDADLVVFDPDVEWVVDAGRLAHRHSLTPYAGARLTGRPLATYLRGRLVASGDDVAAAPSGRILARASTDSMR